MTFYTLDAISARQYLAKAHKRELWKAPITTLIFIAYVYFYRHEQWLIHKNLILLCFGIGLTFVLIIQVIINRLKIRKLAGSRYYIQDNRLIHELLNGDRVLVDLNLIDLENSDIDSGRFVTRVRKITLPTTLPNREGLIDELATIIASLNSKAPTQKRPLSASISRLLINIVFFVILTILTQIGGLIYIPVLIISKKLNLNKRKTSLLFTGSYLIFTLLIIPLITPLFGRSPLPIKGNLEPQNYLTVLLNRHYVKKDLKAQLVMAAGTMNDQFPGTSVRYLDANFPFISGFPLLPHLSHNDGKKVDLGFFYTNKETGNASNASPSFIGYGVYDSPGEGETNYPKRCKTEGYWQYGFLERLVPQWKADSYTVDVARTKALLKILLAQKETSKIFIEPHLKTRWGLSQYDKVRFHGCQAVRHDDHIHLQIQ